MPKNQQAGSFSFSSLGTSNRTVGAALVGAGGSRPGAGGLARLYNWCGRNQPDNIVACVFGGETSLWVLGGSIVGVEPGVEPGAGTTRVPELYTSPDGVTWTAVVNQPFTQGILSGVFYEHGLWFATCQNTNSSTMAVSKDGLRWTPLGNNDPFATPGGGVIKPISSALLRMPKGNGWLVEKKDFLARILPWPPHGMDIVGRWFRIHSLLYTLHRLLTEMVCGWQWGGTGLLLPQIC